MSIFCYQLLSNPITLIQKMKLSKKQKRRLAFDSKYRNVIGRKKLDTLKVLSHKYNLLPKGKIHPDLLLEICIVCEELNYIRECGFNRGLLELDEFWEPFPGWLFFEDFKKLPKPIDTEMIEHLAKQNKHTNLLKIIYTKLGIEKKKESSEDLGAKDLNKKANSGALKSIVPPNTPWEKITITYIDDSQVLIEAPNCSQKVLLRDIGLTHRNDIYKFNREGALLKILVKENGRFDYSLIDVKSIKGKKRKVVLEQSLKCLRKKLKDFFNITDNPIRTNRGNKTIKTEFKLRNDIKQYRESDAYKKTVKKAKTQSNDALEYLNEDTDPETVRRLNPSEDVLEYLNEDTDPES